MLPKKAAAAIAPGKPKGKLKAKPPAAPAAPAAGGGAPAIPPKPVLKAGASKKLKGMG